MGGDTDVKERGSHLGLGNRLGGLLGTEFFHGVVVLLLVLRH